MKPECQIDGANFSDLEGFYEEIAQRLIPDSQWGRNLDALNDVLRGGFGTPAGGFILVWLNSALSRERLGHPETVRQLEQRLEHCHPSYDSLVTEQLEAARSGRGPTVFDWLVDIIQDHGSGGEQADDGVELVLR